nr:unnamed protein product [Callosobruchus analis]
MVNRLLALLLLFCVFPCVLVGPQSPGFSFSFETENGVKRAYAYGTPDFHGTYFYYTNDGVRHVVNFGGSERASGSFVALAASRPVGPPAPARYPGLTAPTSTSTAVPAPAAYYGGKFSTRRANDYAEYHIPIFYGDRDMLDISCRICCDSYSKKRFQLYSCVRRACVLFLGFVYCMLHAVFHERKIYLTSA